MRSILVLSDEQEVYRVIRSCHRSAFRVALVSKRDTALDTLRTKRYDYLFADIELLREPRSGNGYRGGLQAFWEVNPTIEIIVMAPQSMIREAVMGVKAGASNYLLYPLNPAEVRFVTESVDETPLIQSEHD